mmetsp:Transcript_27597/g.54248  ORF Transcript_27597/g.54248 Transcript_27597/m.54248 type:complete len:80 (-) Transcript_27597:640-879(-)
MHLITRFYSVLWSFSLGNFLVADKILNAGKYLCSVLLWIFALFFHSFSLKKSFRAFCFYDAINGIDARTKHLLTFYAVC